MATQNQQQRPDKTKNSNLKPDTNQVPPEKSKQVESEGKQFSTQNKNPGSYETGPEVNEPPKPGQPEEYEMDRDLEGEDEPQPYHDLQGESKDDPAEGPRDQDNRH
jgi:hypothetical protein